MKVIIIEDFSSLMVRYLIEIHDFLLDVSILAICREMAEWGYCKKHEGSLCSSHILSDQRRILWIFRHILDQIVKVYGRKGTVPIERTIPYRRRLPPAQNSVRRMMGRQS